MISLFSMLQSSDCRKCSLVKHCSKLLQSTSPYLWCPRRNEEHTTEMLLLPGSLPSSAICRSPKRLSTPLKILHLQILFTNRNMTVKQNTFTLSPAHGQAAALGTFDFGTETNLTLEGGEREKQSSALRAASPARAAAPLPQVHHAAQNQPAWPSCAFCWCSTSALRALWIKQIKLKLTGVLGGG